jgi:DNA-binding CsgD family transcriptional regulator
VGRIARFCSVYRSGLCNEGTTVNITCSGSDPSDRIRHAEPDRAPLPVLDVRRFRDEWPMSSIDSALSDRNARRALTAFQAIAGVGEGYETFVQQVLDELSHLLGSDLTTLSLCDLERGTRTVVGRPGEVISEQERAAFNRHFHEHPLVRFHAAHIGGPTQRITDCMSYVAFRQSPVFTDYYRRIGIAHVMALPLWIDDANVISLVFNRARSDFTDAERAMLDVLRNPLGALYRSIVVREEASVNERSLAGIVAENGWHLVAVNGDGGVSEMSEAAARVLRHFFADAPNGGRGKLPSSLASWLARRSRNWGLDRLQTEPYSAHRAEAKLTVHFIADPVRPERGHLLIRRERAAVSGHSLESLPLTARERDVLALVAAGKTNTEIGMLLAISGRTVQKHLEHVFEKLGVETRTAAALRAVAAADGQL